MYRQLEWVILDAHASLLDILSSNQAGNEKLIVQRCERLSALITHSIIPQNDQLLALQEKVRDFHHLFYIIFIFLLHLNSFGNWIMKWIAILWIDGTHFFNHFIYSYKVTWVPLITSLLNMHVYTCRLANSWYRSPHVLVMQCTSLVLPSLHVMKTHHLVMMQTSFWLMWSHHFKHPSASRASQQLEMFQKILKV